MTKLLFVVVMCLFTGGMAHGQGSVNFSNPSTQRLTTNGFWSPQESGPIAPAGSYIMGLFIGSPGSSYDHLWPVAYATNSGLAGQFSGGANFAIPGNQGSEIAFQVRAWSVGLGYTWTDVRSNVDTAAWQGVGHAWVIVPFPMDERIYMGASAIGDVVPATGITLSPDLFGTRPGQVTGFALEEIIILPEPGTTALLGLGLAGLLLMCRRTTP